MDKMNKEKKLREHVSIAAERTLRQIEKRERRERRPGELESIRKEFIPNAERLHKTKLHEVWNK